MKTIYLSLRGNFDSSDLKKIIKKAGCKDKQELDDKFKLVYDEDCDCYYIHICQVPFSEILTDGMISTLESMCKNINHDYFQKIFKTPKDKKLYEYFGFNDCDVDEDLKTWEDALVIFEKEN